METNEVPRVMREVPKGLRETPGLDDIVASLITYHLHEDEVMQSSERDLFCQEVRNQLTTGLKDNYYRYNSHEISSLSMRCDQVAKEMALISLAIATVDTK